MKIRTMILPLVSVAALSAAYADDGGRPLSTLLTGATEVPGPGDADGQGSAEIRINPGQGQLCYTLKVSGIDTATAAHVHEAVAGTAGPVGVGLTAPVAGTVKDCVTITRELAKEIIRTPSDYYVNVHNAAFPRGAVRGQLGK